MPKSSVEAQERSPSGADEGDAEGFDDDEGDEDGFGEDEDEDDEDDEE